MLADRDLGAKQASVHRTGAHMHVVDVGAIDSDQCRSIARKPVCSIGREIRVVAEIALAAPMSVPSCVNQNCLASNLEAVEIRCFGLKCLLPWPPQDDAGKVGKRVQREVGEVLAIGVAMKGVSR